MDASKPQCECSRSAPDPPHGSSFAVCAAYSSTRAGRRFTVVYQLYAHATRSAKRLEGLRHFAAAPPLACARASGATRTDPVPPPAPAWCIARLQSAYPREWIETCAFTITPYVLRVNARRSSAAAYLSGLRTGIGGARGRLVAALERRCRPNSAGVATATLGADAGASSCPALTCATPASADAALRPRRARIFSNPRRCAHRARPRCFALRGATTSPLGLSDVHAADCCEPGRCERRAYARILLICPSPLPESRAVIRYQWLGREPTSQPLARQAASSMRFGGA